MKISSKKNLAFLKLLGEKTVTWYTSEFRPNMSNKIIHGRSSDFTCHTITKQDFEQVLDIIRKDLYLVMPKENLMGFIEGYDVCNRNGDLILRFGTKNLPPTNEFSLESVFTSVVRSKQNLELHKKLMREKKVYRDIYSQFSDYDY